MSDTHSGHHLLAEKLPSLQQELAVASVKFDHARTAKTLYAAELIGHHTITLADRAKYLDLLKMEQQAYAQCYASEVKVLDLLRSVMDEAADPQVRRNTTVAR